LGPKTELSSYRDFGLRSSEMLVLLVLRIHDFLNPDMSMALFFQDFSRVLGFTPCVPTRWTILIQPQDIATCDAPLTQLLCQLETPDAETSMVSSMSTMCLVKQMAVILSLFHESRFREFRTLVAMVFPNREFQNFDLTALGSAATCSLRWMAHKSSRDFAISHIGVFGVQSPLLVQLSITDFAMG
jgi:hypothetical protein